MYMDPGVSASECAESLQEASDLVTQFCSKVWTGRIASKVCQGNSYGTVEQFHLPFIKLKFMLRVICNEFWLAP